MIINDCKRGLTPEDRASGFFNNENTRTDVNKFQPNLWLSLPQIQSHGPSSVLEKGKRGWDGKELTVRNEWE